MSKELTFKEKMEKHFKILEQYVPIVARVHGEHHPEFFEVKSVFDAICVKVNDDTDLTEEFKTLRAITDNYKVPGDVCETYATVYQLLSEMDDEYHKAK